MEFDSFYITLGGITDDGSIKGEVIIGFSDDDTLDRGDIEIPFRLKSNLDASLHELREQAKAAVIDRLREATKLLEQFSTDQLHSKAQDAHAEKQKRSAAQFEADLAKTLGGGA